MADYISREAAKEFFLNMDAGSRAPCSTLLTLEEFTEYLDEIPAADVEPVRHGRWKWETEDIYLCSACGDDAHVKEVMGSPVWQYCPNCGAKMEGNNENN